MIQQRTLVLELVLAVFTRTAQRANLAWIQEIDARLSESKASPVITGQRVAPISRLKVGYREIEPIPHPWDLQKRTALQAWRIERSPENVRNDTSGPCDERLYANHSCIRGSAGRAGHDRPIIRRGIRDWKRGLRSEISQVSAQVCDNPFEKS
ncbi:hypothetical protein KM043_017243 [Ampulex compressa]|nr:hypothetical protein KM043_017243 [Ampulex compressa]